MKKIAKKLSAKKKKALLSAVLAGISFWGAVLPQTAEAMEEFNIGWDGKTLFNIQYYGASDKNKARETFFNDKTHAVLNYDLTSDVKSGLNKAFKWWAEILGPGANISQPAQYFVGTYDDQNAGAVGLSAKNNDSTENPNFLKEIFQSGQTVPYFKDIADYINNEAYYADKNIGMGQILIGQYLGFDALKDGGYGFINAPYYANPTPQIVLGTDISAVMFHEIGHSLGISAFRRGFSQEINGTKYTVYGFADFDDKSFSAHLYDQYGTKATPGAMILSSKEDLPYLNVVLDANPSMKAEVKLENTLYVPNTLEARRDGKVYLYFAGKNVSEVLDGKTFTRGDGEQISGIPINLWERGVPDFSHIELERSMMSHQNYRSYVNFMEAELAAFQDMGYNIDRKNFYGRSIYMGDLTLTNTQGFSKRENGKYVDGYNNSTFGIGLHVYGSNNNITQAGNVYANGAGAVGVRVDGVNNTITVPQGTEIHADGSYNDGILIAYGKNHNVNVDGEVTATGENGNALSFDFGANSLGANMEMRGSFMRYVRYYKNNSLVYAKNLGSAEFYHSNDMWSFSDTKEGDLNAPMVNTANISGKLTANSENYGNAIYIDSTAFVDTININDGAKIKGNIHSQWKHFSPYIGFYDNETPYESGVKGSDGNILTDKNGNPYTIEGLKIQYNGGQYLYTKYIPDLVTKLNFNNTMKYDGDIDGMDNMKMNVNGNLVYSGAADVVNVNVAKGAGLFGGTYTVNDMSAKIADGFADDTTGKFYNHGTIGSADSDKSMTINGDLISDGVLSGYAGGEHGDIAVNGAANVEGSTATATNILPGESMTVLTAEKVTGNLKNSSTSEKISGLMSATGEVADNKVLVSAKAENNIGELSSEETQSFNALNNMNTALKNDDRKSELRTVYNLDAASAKSALSAMGNNTASDMFAATESSSVVNGSIRERALSAFHKDKTEPHYNGWVKYTKNWGDLKSGANYHSQGVIGGYDEAMGKNWRGGVFVGYNATGLGAKNASGNIYDTRFGLYALYHKDVNDAYIYADYGEVKNRLYRGIPSIGVSTEAKYDSTLFEIGGEFKRNLQPNKIWSVSPFINLQYTHLKQDAYNENGGGIFNHRVKGKSGNYLAGQLGVEFKRNFKLGSYAARLGVKHAFTNPDGSLDYSYEGDSNNVYTMKNDRSRTHFVLSLTGENEFAKGWILGGDFQFQKGGGDKDLSASLVLKKVW